MVLNNQNFWKFQVQKIMRASTSLGMSVEESQRNLQLLKDAKKALNADLKDKRAASAVSFQHTET